MTTDLLWRKIQQTIGSPKVRDTDFENYLQHIRDTMPVPVIWLLGKAQSGKTAIVRALTQDSRAEIGNGFKPCTRTAYLYDFPNADQSIIKFLDTRGLGEIAYAPDEDMSLFQEQAHLLMIVVKAMDHAQDELLRAVQKIHAAKPDWPMMVVQTTLHEGYASPDAAHPLPYPFDAPPYGRSVPQDLSRSLARQREAFRNFTDIFVPVDLTLPEDGFEPVNYGIEALWQAIEHTLPLGMAAIIRNSIKTRKELSDPFSRAAAPHILVYSIAAAGSGAIPIPLVDIPLFTLVQAKMFQTLASIYDQEMNKQRFQEFCGSLGAGLAAQLIKQLIKRQALKVIPGYGSAIGALYNGAATFALGKTLCAYFRYIRQGNPADPQLLQSLYKEQFEIGRKYLKTYINAQFEK